MTEELEVGDDVLPVRGMRLHLVQTEFRMMDSRGTYNLVAQLELQQGNYEKGETMLEHMQEEYSQKRYLSIFFHMLSSPIMWMVLVVAASIFVLATALALAIQPKAPVPSDVFMQSVIKRDGSLGWHQLCSSVQAQVPLSVLTSRTQEQRNVESKEGLSLTLDYIGAHAQPNGGEVRMYVVTARRPGGWVAQRIYIVVTQASGCVEDVKNF